MGRGVGFAGAEVGGGLAGRLHGCVVGDARGWVLPASWVEEGEPLGFGLGGTPIVGVGVCVDLLWFGRWSAVAVGDVGLSGVGLAVPLVLMS